MFIYNTGENHWDRFKAWPLACADGCGQKSKPLYLTAGFILALTRQQGGHALHGVNAAFGAYGFNTGIIAIWRYARLSRCQK